MGGGTLTHQQGFLRVSCPGDVAQVGMIRAFVVGDYIRRRMSLKMFGHTCDEGGISFRTEHA